jgi:glyoxylase I family protein
MPELKGFSHIDLTVSDRERAAAWWHDVMGFTVVSSWRGDTFDVITLMHWTYHVFPEKRSEIRR